MRIRENQPALFENIEKDNEPTKKAKSYYNCIADVLNEILFERKISLSRVQKDTGIPFPTLDDWIKARTIPLTDDNLMVLAKYLNTPLEHLCYGIGQEENFIKNENDPRIERIAAHFNLEKKVVLEVINGGNFEE